ncbi:MAG: SH3 domain-containing protein [Synergistaceae bacterium]|jgi:cell wall-associated NlpC family hydrolase|nr:SH3 domain-containing protein [Synergistaceae bacterium]
MIKSGCLFCVAAVAFAFWCGPRAAAAAREFRDIERFPQSGAAYLPPEPDAAIVDCVNQAVRAEEYLRRHFAPWNGEARDGGPLSFLDLTFDRLPEYYASLAKKRFYAPGGGVFPKKSLDAIVKNGAVNPSAAMRPGVAISAADIRVFPYGQPLYNSKTAALGSGGHLKLDALQVSTMRPGEPLAIFNASADSNWFFAATGTAVGWVKVAAVAPAGRDFIDIYVSAEKSVLVKDNVEMKDADEKTAAAFKLGTVFPSENGALLIPVRGKSGFADAVRRTPEEGAAEPFPVRFTPKNAARAIDAMMGEPYGWGGKSGLRDCSAMTRDYFSTFGIWLPRNSGDQSLAGSRISLKASSVKERNEIIVREGVPFATLIHMPGHIMLYLGLYDGEPAVFHNTWGVIVTGGRAVVGRAVVTGLRLGEEIPGKPANSLLIDRIDAISFPMTELAVSK